MNRIWLISSVLNVVASFLAIASLLCLYLLKQPISVGGLYLLPLMLVALAFIGWNTFMNRERISLESRIKYSLILTACLIILTTGFMLLQWAMLAIEI